MLAVRERLPGDRERVAEHALAAQREGRGGGLVRTPAQHDELVPAEPADGVLLPGLRGKPAGDRADQLVPGVVAQAVVDRLEPVDVQEEHRHRPVPGTLQFGVDEVLQVPPVGQVGQVVHPGPAGAGAHGLDPGADVGVRDDQPAGVVDPRGLHVHPLADPARGQRAVDRDRGTALDGQLPQRGQQPAGALVVTDGEHRLDVVVADAERHTRPVPQLVDPGGVDLQDRAVRVEQHGRGRQGIQHRTQLDRGPRGDPR